MIKENIRKLIQEICPESVIFDNPSFDDSIIGISAVDNAIIYDKQKMIRELMLDDNCSEEEAIEFIEYNTERAIPYSSSEGVPPVILDYGDVIRMEIEEKN